MRRFVHSPLSTFSRAGVIGAGAMALLAHAATAQNYRVEFTADWQGPTVGLPDSMHGLPITEGDVLLPPAPGKAPAFGPLPTPSIYIKAGPPVPFLVPHLGLAGHPFCVGHPGGTPCKVEVDALDLGQSLMLTQNTTPIRNHLYFSVDRKAIGFGVPVPPSIATEGPIGDLSNDILVDLGLGFGPLPPFAGPMIGSTVSVDGDGNQGASAFLRRGVGLKEPPLAFPNTDNLDGLMFDGPSTITPGFPAGGVWFSLDSAFVDPLTGVLNSGSAAFHGFVGGDVLYVAAPGGPPVVYAPAPLLGLDPGLLGDRDDLDALILLENGFPGYQPSAFPYDWLPTMAVPKDMLLFSVRRGSFVIGLPDSIFGIPIEPGDLLVPPVAGGVSPFPGIFIAAENLGLATKRTHGIPFGDDLDAAELPRLPLYDCNGNGREDAVDIGLGTAPDANNNGIPDTCEMNYTQFCFCPPPLGPCGNNDATAGCRNSAGTGALMTPSGTTSVIADDLVLTTSGMPTFKNCIGFWSFTLAAPAVFYDGRRCLFSPIKRLSLMNSGATGSIAYGPGLAASEGFLAGQTVGFQTWYRDPTGPCASTANVSSAVRATFTP